MRSQSSCDKFILYGDRSSALRLYAPSNLKDRVVKFNPGWPIFWPAETFYACIVWFTLHETLRLKLVGTKWTTSRSNEYFKGEWNGWGRIKCTSPQQDIKTAVIWISWRLWQEIFTAYEGKVEFSFLSHLIIKI